MGLNKSVQNWKKVKLKHICDLQNGYAFKSEDYIDISNTVNCRMSNIRPDSTFDIEYNIKYLPDSYAEKYSDYLLKDGDLIVAMTDLANDPKILGVPTIVNTKGYKVMLNQRVAKLIIKNKVNLSERYLKYALSLPQLKGYYKKFAGGGLQINIGKDQILNVELPLADYTTQKKIVEVLETAEKALEKRKEANRLLNEYLPSMYNEKFANRVDLKEYKIEDLAMEKGMRTGPFGSDLKVGEFVDEGIAVLGIDNAVNNRFEWDELRYITNEKYEKLKRYTVYPEDVIITIMGTTGRVAVVPNDIPIAISTKHLATITFNKELVNPHFIAFALINDNKVKRQILKANKGAIMNGLNLTLIKGLKVNLPSFEEQTDFMKYINKFESITAKKEELENEIENLFNSLMQDAFNGKLKL